MRSRKKSKSFQKQTKVNSHNPKLMGHSEGSPEREVHSHTGLPKKGQKFSNKQSNPRSTRMGGTKPRNPRASRSKEVAKVRAELNDIETKRTI